MRRLVTKALIVCAEFALAVGDGLKALAKGLVANDLNRRSSRQRSDGK